MEILTLIADFKAAKASGTALQIPGGYQASLCRVTFPSLGIRVNIGFYQDRELPPLSIEALDGGGEVPQLTPEEQKMLFKLASIIQGRAVLESFV